VAEVDAGDDADVDVIIDGGTDFEEEKRMYWEEVYSHGLMIDNMDKVKHLITDDPDSVTANNRLYHMKYIEVFEHRRAEGEKYSIISPWISSNDKYLKDKMKLWRQNAGSADPPVLTFQYDRVNVALTYEDANTLVNHKWIDGNVITAFLIMICQKSYSPQSQINHYYPMCYTFNTAFYYLLSKAEDDNGNFKPEMLHNITLNVDIFQYDKVFIPCHVNGNHWTLFVIDNEHGQLRYYDNMERVNLENTKQYNHKALKRLLEFFNTEICRAVQNSDDVARFVSKYQIIDMHFSLNKQNNGSECGVNVMLNAFSASRNFDPKKYYPYDGKKATSAEARKWILLSLLEQKIGWGDPFDGSGKGYFTGKDDDCDYSFAERRKEIEECWDFQHEYA
jgi:Ulp1 family protease